MGRPFSLFPDRHYAFTEIETLTVLSLSKFSENQNQPLTIQTSPLGVKTEKCPGGRMPGH
jgi:hypothetical protein